MNASKTVHNLKKKQLDIPFILAVRVVVVYLWKKIWKLSRTILPEYWSDSSSDSESFNPSTSKKNLSGELESWCLKFNCSQAAMNSLLDILRRHGNTLSKDARTLLKVPQEVQCVRKCGGIYYYFGLGSGIKKSFTGSEREILLSFSIDGLPLFKSSNTQIWPILCEISGGKIFIVAYTQEKVNHQVWMCF